MRLTLFILFFNFFFIALSQEYSYPLVYQSKDLKKDEKRIDYTHTLPFFDDFSSTYKRDLLWLDDFVFINNTYCISPPNYGVATFDGLDSLGLPYNNSILNLSGVADKLTSCKIDLQGLSDVYFSFFYQKKGRGDEPEDFDSLNLYFKKDSTWNLFWSIVPDSCTSDSVFFKETYLIPDSFYVSGFQFKFTNYASLGGSFDNWHIDNILISEDTYLHQYQDISFSENVSSFLYNYSSLPWKHYVQNTKYYLDSIIEDISLFNNYGICKNKDYKFDVFDHLGNHVDHYYKGDPPDVNDFNSTRQVDFVTGFSFIGDNLDSLCSTPKIDISDNVYSIFKDSSYLVYPTFQIRHIIFSNDVDSIFANNDTMFVEQKFRDWYSYDDGTPEAAYGLNVSGGKLAYKFESVLPDTIYAVDIYFDHSINDISNSEFQIIIFDDNNGYPGSILFQSSQTYTPQLTFDSHGFYRFFLEEGVYVENDFYIGFIQLNSDLINLGLDRNNINNDKMFFDIGGGWLNSSCNGCLGSWMMRPVFEQDELLEVITTQKVNFTIFPNPSKGVFNFIFDSYDDFDQIKVVDFLGNIIYCSTFSSNIDLSFLSDGVYVAFFLREKNIINYSKIVINK